MLTINTKAPFITKSLQPKHVLLIISLFALIPFLLNLEHFQKLIWFGDAWDELGRASNQGLGNWAFTVFAENYVPLFKFLWLSTIQLSNGSYIAMMSVVWITHALVVYCYGSLLIKNGVPLQGTAFSMIILGLTWTNIETLTWSIQWSASLSILFFLLAFYLLSDILKHDRHMNWKKIFLFFLCNFASQLCFSRGVLTGIIFSLYCLIMLALLNSKKALPIFLSIISILPSFLLTALILKYSSGNHLSLTTAGVETYYLMLQYAMHYFLLNPVSRILQANGDTTSFFLLVSTFKIGVFSLALFLSKGQARMLVLIFLLLDLGNAALLGIGRYHTGLEAALGSRYQYTSLICFGVPLAIIFEKIIARLNSNQKLQSGIIAIIFLAWSAFALYRWDSEIKPWVHWRGIDVRTFIANTNDSTSKMPGIPFLTREEARKIATDYNLH